jgi:hypothetical protein
MSAAAGDILEWISGYSQILEKLAFKIDANRRANAHKSAPLDRFLREYRRRLKSWNL